MALLLEFRHGRGRLRLALWTCLSCQYELSSVDVHGVGWKRVANKGAQQHNSIL